MDLQKELESDRATRGISSDEQAAVRGEIEQAFLVRREAHDEHRFRYTPLRRGALLPLLINLGALALTAGAVLFLIALFERDERSLAEVSAAGQTAQSRLLEQFRADADAQLLQSEREIQQIRAELEELRGQVPADQRDQTTAERVAALEAQLESAETLSSLQRLQRQEQLLAAQLSAALTRIGELEAELEQQPEPVTSEPPVVRELPEDNAAELLELRATAQQLEADIERLRAERDSLAAERASLASRQTQLTAERDRLLASLERLERDLAAARTAEEQRAALRARLDSVSSALADARTAAAPGREELMGKVEAKVEVLRILSTEPIDSRYPGLDRQLEDYLDTLASESRREGRIAGLQEAVELLERVSGSNPATANLEGRFAAVERAVVQDILQELQQLLR
ncbi:MAG: hypothetical protein ACLFPV_13525 [Spirochaetaceae bacterium]